jgi:glycosyltransferase involved in cell wall biosynthesis
MNLAILIGHFPPGSFGGAELQAQGWAERLSAHHRVTVITRRDPADQPAREHRDGYDIVRLAPSPVPVWRTVADLHAIERAVAALEPRPDLLLCFQTFISGLAGTRAGRRLGVPAVVWIRGEAEYRLRSSRKHALFSPAVWSAAAGVLVQSEANRADLLAELERAAPARVPLVRGKLAVIENGLDLPAVTPLPADGWVLSVGRLIEDKGMDVVLDACARAGRRALIVGDGPQRAALEQQAAALGGGSGARFTGYVGRDELAGLYRDAAVAVLAARRGEGLPNVLLEAMAHGRPVIATPCAGTRDLLADGANGLLVPSGDAAALAAALGRLRDEPGLAERLAAAGRATAERFDWRRVQPRLEAALERWRRR